MSLALEPAAIEAVLKELRTYVRSADKNFVCASIRAVGRVAELARLVYDRHGQKSKNSTRERQTANRIALDCLYGLAMLTQVGDNKVVIGEAVCVMQAMVTMLLSDGGDESGSLHAVEDPNGVQNFALRRILILLVNTLAAYIDKSTPNGDQDDEKEESELEKLAGIELPEHAVVAALSIIGDWLTLPTSSSLSFDVSSKSQVQSEIVRLLNRTFPETSQGEKCQAVHFCAKVLLCQSSSDRTVALCEHILSMGRIDVHPDVKDQARMASAIINMSCGLKYDTENLEVQPSTCMKLNINSAKKLLLVKKPAPSFLTVEDDKVGDKSLFRFGTLSSLVGHQARGTYLQLLPWSERNSPKSLRDPVEAVKEQLSGVPFSAGHGGGNATTPGFYGGDVESESSSSEDSSSSESSSGGDDEADSDSDSSDSSSSGTDDNKSHMPIGVTVGATPLVDIMQSTTGMSTVQPKAQVMNFAPFPVNTVVESSSDSSSSEDDSSSSSSGSENRNSKDSLSGATQRLIDGNLLSLGTPSVPVSHEQPVSGKVSSVMDDLRGLVMAPIAVDASKATDSDIEHNSSAWIQLVRPQVGGGLSVRARFLRGPIRVGEAKLKGLDPEGPNVLCVQVQFGNK